MPRLISSIRAAMGYAHDKEVSDKLRDVLTLHERDLEDVGYETSTETEEALKELELAMDDVDERASTRRVELKEAQAEAREAAEEEEAE